MARHIRRGISIALVSVVLGCSGGVAGSEGADSSVDQSVTRQPPNPATSAGIAQRLGRRVDELEIERQASADGRTHLKVQQLNGGLRVYGAYAKLTLSPSGEVIHSIDRLAPSAPISAPTLSPAQVLRVALSHHGYDLGALPIESRRDLRVVSFETTADLAETPTVERVAFRDSKGNLRGGFLVETWGLRSNLLHETLINDEGLVEAVELRTNTDKYNVFTEDPLKGPQSIVSGPTTGGTESPNGWLGAGAQNTLGISGNNVLAYLDADGNNKADRGGTAITNGEFLTIADLTRDASLNGNRSVGVQNLFYFNNVIHDKLYRHGFTEAAGNFQSDNFGRGGSGSDPVQAEAQDGSGTDNANFSTPADGRKPRMQMYLWHGAAPTHEVQVNAPASVAGTYDARGAEFGAALTTTGLTGAVALFNDGTGTSSDACEASVGSLSGKIALVDRGTCAFTQKVLNAQAAGAVAVIVANTEPGGVIFAMGGTERRAKIPSVMVSLESGAKLRSVSGVNATARFKAVQAPMLDGDVDSDIVFHEYGHGLTWRMIGGMSGKLAGAIGEGASDVVAFLMNGDDRIGEYSASSPAGIRRSPYSGYPRTYKDVTGSEVHDDGEIYAAAMWRLKELFTANGLSELTLWNLFVDGMNYTPSTPAFEDMRDGMLQADATRGTGARCLIWRAFAQYGVGVGASGVATTSGVTITESSTLPAGCP